MSRGSRNSILQLLTGALLLTLLAAPTLASQDCMTLVFQGSVEGFIEDCGCPKRPLGGLEHRAAIMESVHSGCENVLAVDAGNMLAPMGDGMRAQSAFLNAESARMGIRTMGIGKYDLHFGLEFLREQATQNEVQFVSTNLLENGKAAFAPYVIEERGGVRIGILSLMDPLAQLVSEDGSYENLTVADPRASLMSVLPELREASDVIVVLSTLPRLSGHDLIRNLDEGHGIDFYIEGEGSRHYERPVTIRGVKVLAANNRGKYMGELRLDLANGQWGGTSEFTLHPVDIKKPGNDAMGKRVEEFLAEGEVAAKSR